MERLPRRQFLASVGAATAGLLGTGASAVVGASSWKVADSPTSKTLYEVVQTDLGPHAVGGSGVVVHRDSGTWKTVISDGPSGNNKTLYGAAVTDDGDRLWMCGSSGRLGEYDVGSGTLTDWSKPDGISNTFTDVEVTGPATDERIYCTMGSGKVLVGVRNDASGFDWTVYDTGGSYTLNAVDFHTRLDGRVVSNGQSVFETHDGGKTWTEMGIADAQNPLFGVVSGQDHIYVGAGNGQIWRHDCTCHVWTPHSAGAKDVNAIERRNGEFLGAANSGRIVEVVDDQWVAKDTLVGNALLGCLIGSPDIAVGKSGTIIERS